jgi:hypothetical protein
MHKNNYIIGDNETIPYMWQDMGQGAAFYIYAYIANFRNLHNSMMSKILPRPAPLPQTHGENLDEIS